MRYLMEPGEFSLCMRWIVVKRGEWDDSETKRFCFRCLPQLNDAELFQGEQPEQVEMDENQFDEVEEKGNKSF